jgi:serine/threonine protein kinase
MGAVYRAYDPDIRRLVAIKTIRWDLLHQGGPAASLAARFRNEARAAGRLSHPGIVAVYEYGQTDDHHYIAMEYLEGCNLGEYFARDTAFLEADVVSIMAQLLDALGHAHDRGVWHRDIKPSNLVIMKDGRLKITDFGIAWIGASGGEHALPRMGTPGYMPPELYRGQAGDQRADLFAAGAVMYQMLAGRPAFQGPVDSMKLKVCHEDPASMLAREATCCWARYDPVLATALAKEPDVRFASAATFRDALLAAYARPAAAAVSQGLVLAAAAHRPDERAAADTSAPTLRQIEYGSALAR